MENIIQICFVSLSRSFSLSSLFGCEEVSELWSELTNKRKPNNFCSSCAFRMFKIFIRIWLHFRLDRSDASVAQMSWRIFILTPFSIQRPIQPRWNDSRSSDLCEQFHSRANLPLPSAFAALVLVRRDFNCKKQQNKLSKCKHLSRKTKQRFQPDQPNRTNWIDERCSRVKSFVDFFGQN